VGLKEAEGGTWNIAKANRCWPIEWVTLQYMGKPKSWITRKVRTDAFKFRQANLTGEAQYHPAPQVSSNKRKRKVEKTWCWVADESVVVINPQPMKVGNRLEDKTEGTLHLIAMSHNEPKAIMICEGTKINQSMQLTDLATVRGKTIKAEMPRGTLESGVTNSLDLAPAQTEYCNKSKVRLPQS